MNLPTRATAAPSRVRRVNAATAADLILRHRRGILPELAIYDVRDKQSFDASHIAGACHLVEAQFGSVLGTLRKSTPVLVYCYHGNASQVIGAMFADFRYSEVYSVDGGYAPLATALAVAGQDEAPRLGELASAALADFVRQHGFDPDDLNAARESGLTPLMRAALNGQVALMSELLALGVAPNQRNGDGNNALWLACVSNNPAAVKALTDAGIDIDNRNDMGATCLMYAASSGKPGIVAQLLEVGADGQIRNFDDARAGDLCANLQCLRLLRHTLI